MEPQTTGSNNEASGGKDASADRFKQELRLLAKDLSREELLEFLIEECRNNPALFDGFLLRFLTNDEQGSDLPFDYAQLIRNAENRARNDWDSFEEYPLKEVVGKLNLRALRQFHTGAMGDVLLICETVLKQVPPLTSKVRNASLELDKEVFFLIEILGKLLLQKEDEEVSSRAKRLCLDLVIGGELKGSGFDDAVWEIMFQAKFAQTDLGNLLAFIDRSIASVEFAPKDPEWEMTDWVLRKFEFLKQDETVEDPLDEVRAYIRLAEIRDLFIEQAINQGRFHAAKELLREGIAQATASEKMETAWGWQEKLLNMAVQEGNNKDVRHLAGVLFLRRGKFNFEFYDLLKSTYSDPEWKVKVKELIAAVGGGQTEVHFSQAHAIASILGKEGELEQLLNLLRENTQSFELILAHYQPLEDDYNVEIIQVFQVAIEEFARLNTGRTSYFKLVQMLKTMRNIKGAAPFVRSTVRMLKSRYPRRTAMHEIFDQSFK